jgi:hypothetical protein
MNNIEKIEIINNKISRLNDIYQANLINIEKIDEMGPEPDYGIDECYKIKQNLELKMQALEQEKQALTNQV